MWNVRLVLVRGTWVRVMVIVVLRLRVWCLVMGLLLVRGMGLVLMM